MDGDNLTESQNLFEESVMAAQYMQIGEIIPGAADGVFHIYHVNKSTGTPTNTHLNLFLTVRTVFT
jgi:hypothetical protein